MSILLTDGELKNMDHIKTVISTENMRQLLKWGIQTHDSYTWIAIITEELGELAKACLEYDDKKVKLKDIHCEAVQLATLSLKMVEMTYLKMLDKIKEKAKELHLQGKL